MAVKNFRFIKSYGATHLTQNTYKGFCKVVFINGYYSLK